MDPDDLAYRKSVRNMVLFLAAIVIVVFAAIFIPPYVNPPRSTLPDSVSYTSGFGFTMHLTLNSTTIAPLGHVFLTGWVNSSSDSGETINATDSWAFTQNLLWQPTCVQGWPVGIGVMRGHYTQDNYTLGTPLQLVSPPPHCPPSGSPQYFLFYPNHSSIAAAVVNGTPHRWEILMNMSLGEGSLAPSALPGVPGPNGLPPGFYTAVFADEWGDVLTADFQVT